MTNNEKKSISKKKYTFKDYINVVFFLLFVLIIIYLTNNSNDVSEPKAFQELTTFKGHIKSISHRKPYRRRNFSRIVLDNFNGDFILYHVPDRKKAIKSLKKGQFVFIGARDEVILDRDGIKTFVIWHIETDEKVIKSIDDEIEFKGEYMDRFFE